LFTALRILRDVAVYRIRKREMANLASSLTIMLALGLKTNDVLVRFAFATALNLAVYLVNDLYDIEVDRISAAKDFQKTEFLEQHRRSGWLALLFPIAFMIAAGLWWSWQILVTLVVAGTVCFFYSARAKRMAFVDLPTILVCGVAGSMVAFPLDRALGWYLAGLLGCFAACFQTVQMVRDHDDDALSGLRTTAVALGTRATILLQRGLLLGSAVYASLVLHRWIGLGMLLTVLLPFHPSKAERHWNRIRLALGLAWLVIVVYVLWTGSSDGLLIQMDRDQRFFDFD
jgi:4-hydroxybenzoate polyprenyltransferase